MMVIINLGMGNLRSVQNKFRKLSKDTIISANHNDINGAEKLVLPGVGHFRNGMKYLNESGLCDILIKKVIEDKTPILGICLGAQLFAGHSEEGDCKGLGWINADVVRFNVIDKIKYKVPHMGWNRTKVINSNEIDKELNIEDPFYFVHSYHLKCNDINDVWMTTKYDYEFVSAIRKDNIYGVQFHPEKSHDAGFELLKKFAEL